jgi:3',5'-cyclic AMP phosphodiesterase CpdA
MDIMRIKPRILFGTLCFLLISDLYGQKTAKGIVFEDLNRNLLKERNEKGIGQVAVSNGKDVVLTGTDGSYSIPVSPGQILFVIKPADYALPVNEHNQPQFFYIHKPNGSPKLEFAGSAPTGELPKMVNFPLIPAEKKDRFSMFVFGDPQPYSAEEVEFFRKGLVAEANKVPGMDMGISMGDLVGDNLDLQPLYIKAVQEMGIPWFNVIGNHDHNYDGGTDSLCDETFEKNFGPTTYSFNHGWVHFIVLDDIMTPDPRGGGGYWGGFRKDQIAFLKNDLKVVPNDRLIILAFHIPISENEGGDPFRDEDRNALFEMLRDYPNTLTLSAHTHFQSQDFFTQKEGWLQSKPHHHFNVGASCGDWYSGLLNEKGIPYSTMRDGTPKGFAILNFDRNQYTADYHVAEKPADYRFSIFAPKVVAQNEGTSAGIWANFFMGAETDSLFCRVDDGAWRRMYHVNEYDPAYLHLLHEWDFTETLPPGRRPSNAERCNHLWAIDIPTKLPEGEHVIEIKAYDMFGRILTQKSAYRIAKRL